MMTTKTFAEMATEAGLRPLKWQGQAMQWELGHLVWHDEPVPEGGDSASMSDLIANDYPDVYETVAFEVPVTLWGDYVGGGVERSNWRAILEDHPETFIDMVGFPGAHQLAIPAGYQGEDAEDLINMMTGLRDEYPLYNDEDHSKLEMELAWEAWDQYLKSDILHELARSYNVDTDQVDEDALREAFYNKMGDGAEFPYLESADSVVFPRCDEIVAELAETLPKI